MDSLCDDDSWEDLGPFRELIVGGYVFDFLDAIERATADFDFDDEDAWSTSVYDSFHMVAMFMEVCDVTGLS